MQEITDHWGLIYVIMKSLDLNYLEIEDKYLNMEIPKGERIIIHYDVKDMKTKIAIVKEEDNE